MAFFKLKSLSLTLVLLLLSGCAGRSAYTLVDASHGIPLSDLNHWQLKARVAIKTPKENVTASLNWQKNERLFDFLISGSFGVTIAHLVQEKDQATLEIPDNEKLYHRDAEMLLHRTLGWEFPIDSLSYWVKGLPSGKQGEKIERDESGKLTKITLGQWQILFSKYRLYQGYSLPKMIKVSHPDISMKVVTKKWQFIK
jgi:outer membrane lipoprotein LolB